MLTPAKLDKLPEPMVQLMAELQDDIIKDICDIRLNLFAEIRGLFGVAAVQGKSAEVILCGHKPPNCKAAQNA